MEEKARNDIVPWAEKDYDESDDDHSMLSQAAEQDIFDNSDSSNHDNTPKHLDLTPVNNLKKISSDSGIKKNNLKNKSLKKSKQSLQSLWKNKQDSKVHSE